MNRHAPKTACGVGSDSPNYHAGLDRFVLQRVLIDGPGYGIAPKIYHVRLAGESAFIPGGLWLDKGSSVGFNAYANSFYASYWGRFTELSAVDVCGMVQGQAFIRLFRVASPHSFQELGSYLVGDTQTDGFTPFHITVPMRSLATESGSEGRIFFDVLSGDGCELTDLCFATPTPPRQLVELSLGICTFNKEEQLLTNLENLERYLANEGQRFIDRIIVVNNAGAPFASRAIAAVTERCAKMRVIEQRNLGGAGGFTRSLLESMKNSSSTHHIMIDDDVFLDPSAIEKTACFLMYADRDLVVGGQMMNLRAPHILYEGGATLGKTGLLERVGVNIDCASPGAIGFYDSYHRIDYNAWWFCAIPKGQVQKIGLPLNIFIRGDDFEYGTRLAEQGVPTISLPGIYVWHEPFEQKTAAWLEYYNMRNRPIFCAAHADESGFIQPGREFYQDYCDGRLAEGDYENVAATLLGLADFLAGPERFFGLDAEDNHNAVRSLLGGVRKEHGLVSTGAGYRELRQALTARLPQLGEVLAAAGTSPASDPLAIGGPTARTALADWQGLTDAVLAALEASMDEVHASWGARAFEHVSDEDWARVFARGPVAAERST